MKANIIRRTTACCTHCHARVEASIVHEDDCIYMIKKCDIHGSERVKISSHPGFYRSLDEYYFSVMPKNIKQRRYYVYLTGKCNLRCPICFMKNDTNRISEMSLISFRKIVKENRGCYFYLYGAEPTLRDDIEDWIRLLKKNGNFINICTNGINIADIRYLARIRKAGLDGITLQFDGFDDAVYERLRGKQLLKTKLKALDNLCALGIGTALNVVIGKGINENQITPIIDYAIKNKFIEDINFTTLCLLGDANDNFGLKSYLMPDELIDITERETNGNVSRKSIYIFQKLYYALLSLFKIRRCFNFKQIILVREKNNSYTTIDKIFELGKFEHIFNNYRDLLQNKKLLARPYLFLKLIMLVFDFKFYKKIHHVPFNVLSGSRMKKLRRTKRNLWVSFGTICDFYKYDEQINDYCSEGFCYDSGGSFFMVDTASGPNYSRFYEEVAQVLK